MFNAMRDIVRSLFAGKPRRVVPDARYDAAMARIHEARDRVAAALQQQRERDMVAEMNESLNDFGSSGQKQK